MRFKWLWILVVLMSALVFALARSAGLTIKNWGGTTWLGANYVCVQKNRGLVYTTGWPVTTHQAAHFVPLFEASANFEPEAGKQRMTLRRVRTCSGVRPKFIPGLTDADGLTVQQWEVEGEGTLGLQRPYPEKDFTFVLYLPVGRRVFIPRLDRFTEVHTDVLPRQELLIAENIFKGEPNTLVYDYGHNFESRYNVKWDDIFKLDEGEVLVLKAETSVQH